MALDAEQKFITKAVVEAVIADAVVAAKTEVQKVATAQSAAADTDAKVADAVTAVQAKGETEIAGLTAAVVGAGPDFATILAKQLDESKKAAKAELEAYTTTQYSDDTDDWSIKVVAGATGYQGKYNLETITGKTADATGPVLSAKAFVEAVISTSLTKVEAATGSSALQNIAAERKIVSNVINGHKIAAAPEDFYMEPVPTKADLEADTSVEAAKAYAINKMEAALATKIADMKEIATDALNAENKKAKPDTDKVNAWNAFLAEVDAQAAAAKKVFTAQINAQKTTAAVYTKDAGTNAINGGKLKAILDEISAYTATFTGDEYGCATLAKKVDITKNVDKLEDYANTLASLVDREGKPMYDANAIKDALAAASEKLYLDNGVGTYDLADAKADVNAAANVSDTLILQKDKFIDAIEGTEGTYDTGVASIKLGTKTYDPWPGALAYEYGAQRDAYKAVVAKTIDAIMAAASYDEIVNAFVAGCKEYDPIITADEHDADWTNPTGVLYKEYDKTYKADLDAYKAYVIAKLGSKYSQATGATAKVTADIKEIVEKAYTKEELPTQVAAAKAYLDGLKSNDELNAAKKEVEALITALPTTVTLANAEQILAAKAANEDYMELAGAVAANNALVLENDVKALAALQLKEINDQVAAIKKAGVTVDSEAAIDALADAVDAYETNYEAEIDATTIPAPDDANDALYGDSVKHIVGFYDQLSDAQVDAVAKQCAAVSLNPTTAAELAAVKAAKAAFEGLSIHQQAALIENYNAYYDKLSQAEKVLGEAVKTLKITASSSAKKGSITVKWTVKGDATAVEGYEIWKSTKHSSGYKKAFTTTKKTYKNTKGLKKGTRYYYKVRAFAYVDGTKITSDWSNKARRIAK